MASTSPETTGNGPTSPTSWTIASRMQALGSNATGFDYLRILLATAVLIWHAVIARVGGASETSIWESLWRPLPGAMLPMFFALSGYLVAGSLLRARLHEFLLLRAMRILPALTLVVCICALVLGPIFTTLPLADYFRHPDFGSHFLNILGWIHYTLPGVFLTSQGAPDVINGQLWTIPFEFACYLALVLLALTRAARSPVLMSTMVIALTGLLTILAFSLWPIDPTRITPGRALVVAFLSGTALHVAGRWIPWSTTWGIAAAILAFALLEVPNAAYVAALPLAYLSVWLGLMTPPRIAFGDLSYGVYLFHFPIQKIYLHTIDTHPPWWALMAFSLPLSILCAWLSWTFVERPLLQRKYGIIRRVEQLARAMFPVPAKRGAND